MVEPEVRVLRPAQAGDICVLLAPDDPGEIQTLTARLSLLQSCHGGRPADPVHLTCQRFSLNGHTPEQLNDVLSEMHRLSGSLQPFPLVAVAYRVMLSARGTAVLKWQIEPGHALDDLSMQLFKRLTRLEAEFLYAPGWVSSNLVTALYEIEDGDRGPCVHEKDLPLPLFTARRMIISHFATDRKFEVLAEYSLQGHR